MIDAARRASRHMANSIMPSSFDAEEWAKAFCKANPGADADIMTTWFANALRRGFDEAMIGKQTVIQRSMGYGA